MKMYDPIVLTSAGYDNLKKLTQSQHNVLLNLMGVLSKMHNEKDVCASFLFICMIYELIASLHIYCE